MLHPIVAGTLMLVNFFAFVSIPYDLGMTTLPLDCAFYRLLASP